VTGKTLPDLHQPTFSPVHAVLVSFSSLGLVRNSAKFLFDTLVDEETGSVS
jgi:hypothetical protein